MRLQLSTFVLRRLTVLTAALGIACAGIEASEVVELDALAERLESNEAPLVLDVRTPGEYQTGHVPGAVNIPHMQIAARAGELGSTDREIVVYCEVGPRARYAQTILRQAGFTDVRHLAGDMAAWRQAGFPVERR